MSTKAEDKEPVKSAEKSSEQHKPKATTAGEKEPPTQEQKEFANMRSVPKERLVGETDQEQSDQDSELARRRKAAIARGAKPEDAAKLT